MIGIIIFCIVLGAMSAALLLSAVTAWHKRDVPRAFISATIAFAFPMVVLWIGIAGAMELIAQEIQRNGIPLG